MRSSKPFTTRSLRSKRWLSILMVTTMLVSGNAPIFVATAQAQVAPVGQGFNLDAGDLRFILAQIKIAEAHAADPPSWETCDVLRPLVGHANLPFGLRTVDGTCNNLVPGQEKFGAADLVFPRLTEASYLDAEPFDPDGPGGAPASPTSYSQKSGVVVDSEPRVVSNLIVDQSPTNPAAMDASGGCNEPGCFIANVAPDVGLSAPYNSLFTLFGQFFDHGLDLVTKGGGTVFIPLKPGDPLFVVGSPTNFMVVTRATNLPGADEIYGTTDDIQEATNTTTPFVDQNQTYTSHPSHQVFLREYALNAGKPVSTGRLIDGAIDGNIGNWAEVKAQAASMLGIRLVDTDVLNVPLLDTDPYGRFRPGPNGYPQLVTTAGLVEGDPLANGGQGVSTAAAFRTGHSFLDDIAHHAGPVGDHDNNPGTGPVALTADANGFPGDNATFTADDHLPGTYDDELLNAHYVTGDGRGNENIGLTAIHSIFHAEHNRLAEDINGLIGTLLTGPEIAEWTAVNPDSGWDYGERLFQAARFVTEMEYQHLVFEEFARKVQPQVNVFSGYHTEIDPAIVAEFAHTVYRFGHSMLTETVARTNADGTSNDIELLDAFLNPLAFNDGGALGTLNAANAAGIVVRGMSQQVGNELDEFVTEALRNRLLGLPLDLATINLARGRSEGIPPLNVARQQFYLASGNPAVAPYLDWFDFSLAIRHPDSVVNFIAAYGVHPSLQDTAVDTLAEKRAVATTLSNDPDFMLAPASASGVDRIDFWVGGLAEKQGVFGGLLGSSFNFVFEKQLEDLQDGDRFYYLLRTVGLNLLVQLEGNSFSELIARNTGVDGLPADVFSRSDYTFYLANLGTSGPIADDPFTPDYNESQLLRRLTNGAIRFLGTEHVNWVGSPLGDRVVSNEGDDTLRGSDGNDIMEGGDGNDQFIGGDGDDILTDLFGDDVIKGGDGNDAISSGPGFAADLNQGGRGHDFVVGGSDPTETFGGPGNDIIFGGDSFDTVFGDEGDDWIEGGNGADLLQGDNGNPFQDDPNGGHDVIIGSGGNDDYDSEGGDDIQVAGPGIERNEGMLGFDWVTHRGDPQPANADLALSALLPPQQEEQRDRFDLVEALSGWRFNDILRGDDADATTMIGHELTAAGVARISGLGALLGGATEFTGGNIILGGDGNDLIEGRGGNDVIDGDAWLNVQLRAPVPGSPGTFKLVDSMTQLRTDVFAGLINPGAISIVRSIAVPSPLAADCGAAVAFNCDTAVFSDVLANYTITQGVSDPTVWTVTHLGGAGIDGTDTLRRMERAQFLDQTILLPSTLANTPATGTVNLSDATPTENQLLTATPAISDAQGFNPAGVVLTWQMETLGVFASTGVSGATFTPNDAHVGHALRVVATFTDDGGFDETVISASTAPVANVNDVPTGAATLSQTLPQEGESLSVDTSAIADGDGLVGVTLNVQWQQRIGTVFSNIAGATGASFTPTQDQVGRVLRAAVSFTDLHGTLETVLSAATGVVGDVFVGTNGADTFLGTAGRDNAAGLGGNDNLSTGAGDDIVAGGAGDDTVNTGAGADIIRFAGTEGFDSVTGGAGIDRIEALAANTVIGLSSLASVEAITGGGFANVVIRGSGGANTLNFGPVTLTNIVSIDGGAGADSITGTNQADTILGGAGGDNINGGAGNDTISGDEGNDTLNGGAGDDVVTGGAGNDTMDGGAGLDVFRFAAGFGSDQIAGFDANPTGGQDRLDISAFGITAATFAANVSITASPAGGTLVTIGGASFRLVGVAPAAVTITDFILAP